MSVKINKLKYPWWMQVIYYGLTVVAPIILLVVQGLYSPHKVFRISFTFICTLLLSWIFIKKFILNQYVRKIQNEKVALEHDYAIEVGNPEKCKYLWLSNELKLVIGDMIDVGLLCAVIILIAVGVKNMTFNVKGTSFMVIIFYLLAFLARIVYLLIKRAIPNKQQ